MTRFFISAGETSGDLHAATVVKALKTRFPDAPIHGIAGTQMVAQGCEPVRHMSELNVMGLGDVLRSLSRIKDVETSVIGWCGTQKPDVAILVDFSSFHMRLGRKLRALGIPVVHFVAPKLWAWGSWRVKKLRKSQDKLACILPFEPEWFAKRGIKDVRYVGNPSAVGCAGGWTMAELKAKLEIGEEKKLLALLPGSRPQELRMHVPILTELLQHIRLEIPDLSCVVPVAPGVDRELLEPLWQQGAKQIDRTANGYAMRADAAVAVSGTATLELALWNTPTVLVYRSSPVTIFLARRLVNLTCAGLANIILGDRPVMPELIQEQCTLDNIMSELMPLLRNETAAEKQREEFSELRRILGDKHAATGVVDMVEELL